MTDPVDPSAPPADVKKPRRGRVALADLVFIVRPPGNPMGIRTFAVDQGDEAAAYAAEVGAIVERLA